MHTLEAHVNASVASCVPVCIERTTSVTVTVNRRRIKKHRHSHTHAHIYSHKHTNTIRGSLCKPVGVEMKFVQSALCFTVTIIFLSSSVLAVDIGRVIDVGINRLASRMTGETRMGRVATNSLQRMHARQCNACVNAAVQSRSRAGLDVFS